MRRIIGVLIFISGFIRCDAQFVKGVGMRLGTTIANQTWHDKLHDQTLLKEYAQGTYIGVNAEFFRGKHFTVITNFAYAQKGCREGFPEMQLSLPQGYSTYKIYDTRFNYFSSSILFKVRFEKRMWVPYCCIGPRLDKLISYSSDHNFIPLEKYMNKKIWGMEYGLGIEYKFGIGGVSAEVQHHYDFDYMLDAPYSDNYSGLTIKNNAFVFNLGIKYYLKSKKKVSLMET